MYNKECNDELKRQGEFMVEIEEDLRKVENRLDPVEWRLEKVERWQGAQDAVDRNIKCCKDGIAQRVNLLEEKLKNLDEEHASIVLHHYDLDEKVKALDDWVDHVDPIMVVRKKEWSEEKCTCDAMKWMKENEHVKNGILYLEEKPRRYGWRIATCPVCGKKLG